MRYVLARLDDSARERAYRIYVTDILRGAYCEPSSQRYADLFKKQDDRSADEIIDNIRAKLGG